MALLIQQYICFIVLVASLLPQGPGVLFYSHTRTVESLQNVYINPLMNKYIESLNH